MHFPKFVFVVPQPPPAFQGKYLLDKTINHDFSSLTRHLHLIIAIINDTLHRNRSIRTRFDSSSYVSVLRKNPVVPSAPMKPLYWTRILVSANATTDTNDNSPSSVPLWAQLEEIRLDNISEFADLFSRQVVAKKPSSKKVEVKSKIEPKKLLDSKRSKSVGILAQSLHVDFHEIETAIYDLDTSVVSLEALQHIYEAVG